MKNKRILTAFLMVLIMSVCIGCASKVLPEEKVVSLTINGDIADVTVDLDLKGIEQDTFERITEGANETLYGWRTDKIFAKAKISEATDLVFTATDGTSAKIKWGMLDQIYLYKGENGQLNVYAPNHPRVVGIKNLTEITVIASNSPNAIPFVTVDKNGYLTQGNAKMYFYEQVGGENLFNGVSAFKYVPKKEEITLKDIFNNSRLTVYYSDYDITNDSDDKKVSFVDGILHCEKGLNEFMPVVGVTVGSVGGIWDSYKIMKDALDKGTKVLAILPDGLGCSQLDLFTDSLSALKGSYNRVSTVNPSISNVALASILTGETPYYTTITDRPIKKPAVQDIFGYAKSINKSVSYIEGNSKLILTEVEPILSTPDLDGDTDKSVFENAQKALRNNSDLTFVHFHGIDDINHLYGYTSSQSKEKLIEIDGYIEKLTKDFDGVVVIVPDHGHSVSIGEKPYGKHGLFLYDIMYVPMFVWGN